MKATLEFDLPEDRDQHDLAVNAIDYYTALWDIYTELHREWKYGERDVVKLDRVYDRFLEIIKDNKVDLS